MLKSASEVRELFSNKIDNYIDKIGDEIIKDAEMGHNFTLFKVNENKNIFKSIVRRLNAKGYIVAVKEDNSLLTEEYSLIIKW